jgi:hypothetical protein
MAEPEKKFVRRGLCFGQRRGEGDSRAPKRNDAKSGCSLEKKNVSQKRELHLKKKIPKKQLRGNASTLASQKTVPQAGQCINLRQGSRL